MVETYAQNEQRNMKTLMELILFWSIRKYRILDTAARKIY